MLQVGVDADLDDGRVRHHIDTTQHRPDVRGTQHHQARRSLVPGTLSYIFWYHPKSTELIEFFRNSTQLVGNVGIKGLRGHNKNKFSKRSYPKWGIDPGIFSIPA